jgi:integral membrane protein (TIGR01906 family)
MPTMIGTEPDRVRRAEAAIAAVFVVLAIVGLTLLPLTTRAYVSRMVRAVDSAALTGLGEDVTVRTAEQVRGFVTDRSAEPLPPTINGRPAYDDVAVSHLVDVREVLVPARMLAAGLGILSLGWALLRWRTVRGRRVVASALRGAGWSLMAAAALTTMVGLLDFDELFARFHGLFFAPGTWQFPADALLIQVFPLQFWIASGAVWAALVLACALGAVLLARRIRFTAGNNGV